jgi:hypothetical protein
MSQSILQSFSIPGAVGVSESLGGYRIDFADGSSRNATAAEILEATKAARIAAINAECRARILAAWPIEKQVSALAGVYGAAQRTAMETLIAAHIDASNTASDLVTAATTAQDVEAVTVAWPV